MPSYDYWHRALALVGDCGKLTRQQVTDIGPVHESDPQLGFFRKRERGKAPLPVAIWIDDDGVLAAAVDGLITDAGEVWTYALWNPITMETYLAYCEGAGWPDLLEQAS